GITNAGHLTVGNSIIAGNLSSDDISHNPQSPSSGLVSEGYNITGSGNTNATSAFNGTNDQIAMSNLGLGALDDNGGFTETHALSTNSIALDMGSGAIAINLVESALGVDLNNDGDTDDTITAIGQLAFDQRGSAREQDGPDMDSTATIDVGAYELQECFLAGTLIRTEAGEKPVEELEIGDRVLTLSGQLEPIKWIGQQTYHRQTAHPLRSHPIHIKPGALGENGPQRDLFVSPDHALLVEGLLINAGALTNGISIVQIQPEVETFTYYHVELHHHALLFAEGTAAESYLPQKQDRSTFDNGDEYAALYPNQTLLSLLPMNYPRVSSKRQLPQFVSKTLEKRARSLYPQACAQTA
ncbi:MAG: Hint domain-containing protein, partial [Merismopedia sp. SIO2A8]|nr:Hint domain-containing protein [Merismopedia sp. SIO2A8]